MRFSAHFTVYALIRGTDNVCEREREREREREIYLDYLPIGLTIKLVHNIKSR